MGRMNIAMHTPHIAHYKGKRIHMIGIGGSSMSGLAQMLKEQGYQVTGSDGTDGYQIAKLKTLGIPVAIGHFSQNVAGADLVVYSAAIAKDNPERMAVEAHQIPSMERSVLLGQLMEEYPVAIGISGAHGKTTTTSMLSQILMDCGVDPSIHIGGQLDYIGGSTRIGKGNVFLAEACEFSASFLEMHPTLAVILNIDADHLDFYKDIDDIENAFRKFLALLPTDGMSIGLGDDVRVRKLLGEIIQPSETYGFEEHNDWQAGNLTYTQTGCARFDLLYHGDKQGAVEMKVPGSFNALNALAALATAHQVGANMQMACQAISAFQGVHRRFEHTATIQGVKLYHDYGHNPAEMRNAVAVAKMQPHNRLWAVMQPHTYSRVKALFEDYLSCTEQADITLVTDIFAAREKDPGDIHATMLVDGMQRQGVNAVFTPSFDDTERYLRKHWQDGDLVLTMGCGNINLLNNQIEENEKKIAKN